MPLVQARCTNCGANLEVDNSKDAAICPYCGTPYVVEKAINHYNVTNHIHADNVNVYNQAPEFEIRAGRLERYHGVATEVTIPDSVSVIGGGAFSNCSGLTSVTIPDSVKVIDDPRGNDERGAFLYCVSLTSVTIPSGVTKIGSNAFAGCAGLTSVTIPDSVTEIGSSAFSSCTGLTSVTIPEGVKTIERWTFAYCTELTSVTIPASVTKIESHAFEDTKLRRVIVPSRTKIDKDSFPDRTRIKSKGCYIATAVYGSYDCPQVWTLRRFRDNALAKSAFGRAFIRLYYAVSPALVRRFGRAPWFQRFWKRRLDKFVSRLNAKGVADTPYQDKP